MAADGVSNERLRSQARRRVAIYGGAYDPITNSHLTCASEIVHSGKADEVWLVPCGKRPDKPKLKTPPIDRYVMCQIAVNSTFSPSFPVKVSDIECFEPEAMFTYDLLCSLRKAHPEVDFVFVIGTDWLQEGTNIATWESKNPAWKPGDPLDKKLVVTGDKLLQEFDFLVVKRPGYEVAPSPGDPTGLKRFGPRLQWLAMERGMTFIEGNLSSTELRKRLDPSHRDAGAAEADALRTIDGLVPMGVLAYTAGRGSTVEATRQGPMALKTPDPCRHASMRLPRAAATLYANSKLE
eukprot:CAMPEP_0170303976 /NCGR_PEP_ID=MMETSP0116_2-20130129/52323_1 /TAXON_ID=400756 /ORGANISM="Durinskia baltica, Strain CSIRO CS-38" /LENGTH=293 /DNA_ID=CAMNT_0010555949 /DNA_START=76 /DNA_END=958 /DNA_ORIENTATION=+